MGLPEDPKRPNPMAVFSAEVQDKRERSKRVKKAKAQEKRYAGKVGGKRQGGSGSRDEAKGDVTDEITWLHENKGTDHASISIKGAYLEKITKEAMAKGQIPAVGIEIRGMPAHSIAERDWTMIPTTVFNLIREKLEGELGDD